MMYSTGSEEQSRGEGEVPVHGEVEGESLQQCTSNEEVTQTQNAVRLTTLSRYTARVNTHCTVNWLDAVCYGSFSVSLTCGGHVVGSSKQMEKGMTRSLQPAHSPASSAG